MKNRKVVIGLSGGVDSSVALWLLKKRGFSPLGLTLKLPVWESSQSLTRENICCTSQALRWVKKLCFQLEVPHFIVDCQKEFKKIVVDYFVKEYQKGRTPNPCMICNRDLRFPQFFKFADKMGADFVATGHYARISNDYQLYRAKDKDKDQSYFLSWLSFRKIKRLIFPLGEYTKKEVYQIAKKENLIPSFSRPESQDFCFAAGRSKNFFLAKKIGQKPGLIIDKTGQVLGQHQGLYLYTIGQRKSLGLNKKGPYYVFKIDAFKNVLVVTKNKKDLYQKKVVLKKWHFISGQPPKKPIKVLAKTRYRQPLAQAVLFPPHKDKLELIFKQPQFAITPGQFAVFYQDNVCLGSAEIA